jgi:hypothetical protein
MIIWLAQLTFQWLNIDSEFELSPTNEIKKIQNQGSFVEQTLHIASRLKNTD